MGEPLDIRPAIVPPDAEDATPRGHWKWEVSGASVYFPIVAADPLKDDQDWLAREAESYPAAEFDREYLGDFTIFTGKPVFEREFRAHLHVARGPLPYLEGRPIVRGWDIPGPLACVWMQLAPLSQKRAPEPVVSAPSFRLHVLAELYAACGIREFAEMVKAQQAALFPSARQYLDYADPAAWAESSVNEKRSAATVYREAGIYLNPGPVNLVERLEPLRGWLTRLVATDLPGEPVGAVLFDPSCVMLIDGLRSGYHYAEIEKSGRYKEVPEKNEYSHPIDALCYGVARVGDSLPKLKEKQTALEWKREAVLGAVR